MGFRGTSKEDGGYYGNRRSWPEITMKILEVTATPSNKMGIMYRSNLNFKRFSWYFKNMLKKGLIEEIIDSNGRSVYKNTKRGKTLLVTLRKAQELLF